MYNKFLEDEETLPKLRVDKLNLSESWLKCLLIFPGESSLNFNMENYKIEYSWKDESQTSMVIVAKLDDENELIHLCDEVYERYKRLNDDVNFYFFQSRDNAVDYIYLRFVLADHAEKAIDGSHCVGHLINDELVGRFSPPKLLKTYRSKDKKIN